MIQVLNAATAANNKPSGATAGFSRRKGKIPGAPSQGFDDNEDRALLLVKSTAGSGTMTVTIRLWGWSDVTDAWHPLGVGTDSAKGTVNGGAAIGETNTDSITHAEIVEGLSAFERFYAEVTAIGGTSTAVSAWLVPLRGQE